MPRPEGSAASVSPSTEISDAMSASRPPPLPGDPIMRSPRSGLSPLAPRNNSPLCRMPSPRLRSTLTTRKSLRSRACPNQCSASATRLASLSIDAGTPSRRVSSAPNGTSRSPKIGVCRHTPADRSTTPGRPTQTPRMSRHFEVGVLDAAPHAVFDEVGDDGRCLPVDADRQAIACEGYRHRNW